MSVSVRPSHHSMLPAAYPARHSTSHCRYVRAGRAACQAQCSRSHTVATSSTRSTTLRCVACATTPQASCLTATHLRPRLLTTAHLSLPCSSSLPPRNSPSLHSSSCSVLSSPAATSKMLRSTRSSASAAFTVRAEKKEYYDFKDMPPLPLTVSTITVPELGHVVVDKTTEPNRLASLAIFYDISKDDQYRCRLTRKSAITALCMYDRDDVDESARTPGAFPNIELLQRVYNQGLDLPFKVEERS